MEIPPFPAPSVLPKAEKRLSHTGLERRRTTKPVLISRGGVSFPRARLVRPGRGFCPSSDSVLPRAGLPAWVPRPTSAFPRVPAVACWTRNSPLRRRSRAGFSPASLFSRPANPSEGGPGHPWALCPPHCSETRRTCQSSGAELRRRTADSWFETFKERGSAVAAAPASRPFETAKQRTACGERRTWESVPYSDPEKLLFRACGPLCWLRRSGFYILMYPAKNY